MKLTAALRRVQGGDWFLHHKRGTHLKRLLGGGAAVQNGEADGILVAGTLA
jgi:hypothetical protein